MLILLVLVSSAILKLHFATVYVTYTDEILSAFVAKSISQTGLPLLPSNSIYPRSLLHHYLLAIPVGIGGVGYLSMRMNSILLSLFTVLAVYLLGSRVSNRWVALSAAFILSISSLFNQFALSGRMYMTFGAFYTLGLYFFYEGFVKEKSSAKWWAIAFMSATMLSSEAGIFLGLVFVFALVIYHKADWVNDRVIYLGGAIWVLLAWFIMFYKIPGSYHPFTAQSGVPQPDFINAHMPVREIIGNLIYPWRALDRSLPLSMPFFLMMTVLVIKKREFQKHYPLVVLLPALFIESFATYRVQYRIIIALLPIYILACCQFVETLWRWTNETRPLPGDRSVTGPLRQKLRMILDGKLKPAAIIIGVGLLLILGILYTNKIRSPGDLGIYVYQAFGYHDSRADQNLQPAYNYLRSRIGAKDPIIVTTVEYGLFFLGPGHDYYYLRQKIRDDGPANFVPFDKEREPYYGKPLIDSIEKLQHLVEASKDPIWIVADDKADSYVSPAMMSFIKDHFELVLDDYEKDRTRVYRRTSNLDLPITRLRGMQ